MKPGDPVTWTAPSVRQDSPAVPLMGVVVSVGRRSVTVDVGGATMIVAKRVLRVVEVQA